MCGRFDALVTWSFFNDVLYLKNPPSFMIIDAPRVIAPTAAAPIIIQANGINHVIEARFGLIPSWFKGPIKDFKATTFNARMETAAEKPVFRDAYRKRHALIPAEAFYEWSGPKNERLKWRITRADNYPLCFAGLWDEVTIDDSPVLSFSLLTRPSQGAMSDIHDREPCLIDPSQWNDWLGLKSVDLNQPSQWLIKAA